MLYLLSIFYSTYALYFTIKCLLAYYFIYS